MRAEALYFDLLRQARRHVVTPTTLTLTNDGHQEILIFHSRFRIEDIPFLGWDKFKKVEFKYALYHVEPPDRLFLLGKNFHIL